MKTAVINLIHNAKQKGEELPVPDLAASFRKAVVDCLVQNFVKAAEAFGSKKLVIAGRRIGKFPAAAPSGRRVQKARMEAVYAGVKPLRRQCGDGGRAGILRILGGEYRGAGLKRLRGNAHTGPHRMKREVPKTCTNLENRLGIHKFLIAIFATMYYT